MFGHAIAVRHCSVILGFTAAQAHQFINATNNVLDSQVLDQVVQQIETGKATIPDHSCQMSINISLTKTESENLVACDPETESKFIKIAAEQLSNTRKEIEKSVNGKKNLPARGRREDHPAVVVAETVEAVAVSAPEAEVAPAPAKAKKTKTQPATATAS